MASASVVGFITSLHDRFLEYFIQANRRSCQMADIGEIFKHQYDPALIENVFSRLESLFEMNSKQININIRVKIKPVVYK
jgi:hypothetical protein